ncbi:dihydropteroate synthase [Stella humosa]|uniref:dihydropteroate synthase n=1 Tax=Stella humosa TaxID=94 RepID=A0A3N1LKA9_9PROT|nr:dihydropteroate synthase [Stella humosa]ROP91308.1 dihydropteroate synthase [Stella humosa]BBK34337.1 dihydropteroate synthase [Stella humosa]
MNVLDELLPPGNGRQVFYCQPIGRVAGPAAAELIADGQALPLAGGPGAFMAIKLAVRRLDGTIAARSLRLDAVAGWAAARPDAGPRIIAALERISAPRRAWAGLALPAVMGVVNVTPDSFSDGGDRYDPAAAVDAALAMAAAGAAIVDVGGESTRPGAAPVDETEELRRVLPVVGRLAAAGVRVSIDTRHARVMREALAAGAILVNDVTALAGDPEAPSALGAAGAPAVLMHIQGEPRTMQADPRYRSALHDVYDHLAGRLAALEELGMPADRFAVDPGIGFGKTVAHNLAILRGLSLYLQLGVPLLVGLSRKGFIGRLAGGGAARDRLGGSLAGALWALERGASILRVHDVAETVQAIALWRAMAGDGPAGETPV